RIAGAAPLKRRPTRGRSHVAGRVVRRAPLERGPRALSVSYVGPRLSGVLARRWERSPYTRQVEQMAGPPRLERLSVVRSARLSGERPRKIYHHGYTHPCR